MLFNYTTPLRSFFENLPENSNQSLPHRQVIENGRSKLFDFDYPVFDESYKNVFETHFIRNFYMREIGFETFGLFKFQLESWLLINMPYWNKMFESELLKYDPLTNSKMETHSTKHSDKKQTDERDITNTSIVNGTSDTENNRTIATDTSETASSTQANTGTVKSDSSTISNDSGSDTTTETDDNFSRQLESNNPDSRLTLTANDGEGVIEYASSIKENNENNARTKTSNTENNVQSNSLENSSTSQTSDVDSNTNGSIDTTDNQSVNTTSNVTENGSRNDTLSSNINDVEDYIQYRIGKIGIQSFPKMVAEYRASLLRIEKQIFEEMNELFMLVY
jgi:hypothetical protein